MKTVTDLQGGKLYDVSDDNFIAPEGQIVVDFIPDEIIELTPEEVFNNAVFSEFNTYLKRIEDGKNAVAKLSAELRVSKLFGIISEESQKGIDTLLTPIRNEVLAGQWISAKELLIDLGSEQIGLQLYDKLFGELTDYINENY